MRGNAAGYLPNRRPHPRLRRRSGGCYEYELYRSAVVMSWLAAVHVLIQVDILAKPPALRVT